LSFHQMDPALSYGIISLSQANASRVKEEEQPMEKYQALTKFKSILLTAAILVTVLSSTLLGMESRVFAENVPPQVQGFSTLLVDARRGQVIYAKDQDEPIKTPVINKLMTALIAVEKTERNAMVTASKEAINVEGAALSLSVGEKYGIRDLVYAVMLTGANDAVTAISEYVGGSEAGFVRLMNEYAAKIGMTQTRFTNVTGTYDEKQYTTANDIAIFLRYAISNTEFNKIFSTQAKPWYDDAKTMLLTNANNMFWDYEGTDGGTLWGSDDDLQTIITTATRSNMRLICILSDSPKESTYADSIALFNYGFDNYRYGTLVAAGSVQETVMVEGETLNLVPTADVHYIYPRGQNYIKNYAISIDQDKLKPPVTKNSIVGIITFTLLDDTVITVELYPDKEILPKKTNSQILKERLDESRELIYVIIGLVILEIILLLSKFITVVRKRMIKRNARRPRLH
jgi:D-alanyl-D-alanine carboxypeptidase (penicillin-binding protein 5/6)